MAQSEQETIKHKASAWAIGSQGWKSHSSYYSYLAGAAEMQRRMEPVVDALGKLLAALDSNVCYNNDDDATIVYLSDIAPEMEAARSALLKHQVKETK